MPKSWVIYIGISNLDGSHCVTGDRSLGISCEFGGYVRVAKSSSSVLGELGQIDSAVQGAFPNSKPGLPFWSSS